MKDSLSVLGVLVPTCAASSPRTHAVWLVPSSLGCSWGVESGHRSEPEGKPVSDMQHVPLHQPFIYLKICKTIGEDSWDWKGANITLKEGKRRHQLHAVTRQPNFNPQKNTGIQGTVKQLKYNN